MYILDQLSVAPNRRIWTLVDATTNLPLLFPLLFLIDRLSLRSESTQSSTLQALKFFYEYWYQKHDVTFCLSFHLSGYNPSIAIREGANKRGNSSRLTQSFHFFMFEPIFSPVNALNQPI